MNSPRNLRLPFVGRLQLALAAVALPVFAILLASVWWNESRSLHQMLQRDGRSMSAGFAQSTRMGVQTGNVELIRDAMSGVQAIPDVARLDVYDARGRRLLAAKGDMPPVALADLRAVLSREPQGQTQGMNERFVAPIHDSGGGLAGYVLLDVSLKPLHRALDGTLMTTLVVCLFLLLFFALLTWMEVRRATRPLFEIDEAVARVAGGDLRISVNEDVGEPFARVARGFNDMVRTLALAQAEDRRKRRVLQESERRFRELFMHMPVAMYIADMQGQLRECNPAMAEMLAADSPAQMLAAVGSEARLFDSGEAHDKLRRELLASGRIAGREVCCKSLHGEELHCLMHMSLVRDPSGRPIGVEGMLQDETELRVLEQNLVQAQKMEALGQLAGGLAHDFNNLLTIIQANAEWLTEKTGGDTDRLVHARRISDAAGRAAELTRNLLGFARKGEMRREAVIVFALLREVVQMLGETVDRRIRIHLGGDVGGRVMGDPGQLHQVFLNLCINAMQAMPEGGDISIHVRCAPERVVVRVSDTGCGMGEDVKEHIFEPFFTTKAIGEGTGLGLAMVYGIVQRLGGEISVQSGPDEGTSFDVSLPRLSDDAGVSRIATGQEGDMSRGLHGTVLLVDDELPVLEVSLAFLSGEGLQVSTARSGEEALEHLAAVCPLPDLVLLDLNMPGMGGVEALATIRRTYPGQKVIVVSGYSPTTLDGGVGDLYYDGFVGKPFRRQDLCREVARVLSLTASGDARRAAKGD